MILYRYIIKEHILPFLYSLGIIIFIFTMTTAVQLLDRIISKGLSPGVVLEIFAIQLGWIVALAIPMSLLTSTLMTFGAMSANNEITAIKATGQNLIHLITPVFIVACLLTLLNIFFNDLVLPDANHRAANLLSDISRKRPAVLIEPGVLVRDFPNYALWVKKVNPQSGHLSTVRIYVDVPGEDPQTIIADEGDVCLTQDEKRLELTLFNGEIHRVNVKKTAEYFVCQFKKQVIFLQSPETELTRTKSDYRSDREMSSAMMLGEIAGYRKTKKSYLKDHDAQLAALTSKIKTFDSLSLRFSDSAAGKGAAKDSSYSFKAWAAAFSSVQPAVVSAEKNKQASLVHLITRIKSEDLQISQYMVEVHKKFSLPFACIVFILIGAPLGIMAKRGGITIGASYSLFFFISYWAMLIWGESLADKCKISPFTAMWSGNILIGLCGLVLLWRLRRESTLFSFAPIVRMWRAITKKEASVRSAAPGKISILLRTIGDVPYFIVKKCIGILPMYLIRKFIGTLGGIFLAIIVLFVVVDYVSNLSRFENASLWEVTVFYWYYLPWLVQIMSPIVILLAAMLSIGSMARWNELTAMKTSGMNVRQLAMPLLFLGVILAGLSFYLGEKILPQANYLRRELVDNIGKQRIVKKHGSVPLNQEYRRDFYYFLNEQNTYFFKEFRTNPTKADIVWRETVSDSSIIQKTIAKSLIYKDSAWFFIDGSVRTFQKNSVALLQFDTLKDTLLKTYPSDMVAQIRSPEEMSYWELNNFVEKTKKRGEDVSRYKAQLYFKLALPVMNFIVVLLGISISARAGRKGGAVLFGIGLILTFSYYIISQFGLVFAQNGQIPPLVGAWFGNSLFLLIALFLYTRASR
jgi:lipopolysaccharide export system permease protein